MRKSDCRFCRRQPARIHLGMVCGQKPFRKLLHRGTIGLWRHQTGYSLSFLVAHTMVCPLDAALASGFKQNRACLWLQCRKVHCNFHRGIGASHLRSRQLLGSHCRQLRYLLVWGHDGTPPARCASTQGNKLVKPRTTLPVLAPFDQPFELGGHLELPRSRSKGSPCPTFELGFRRFGM